MRDKAQKPRFFKAFPGLLIAVLAAVPALATDICGDITCDDNWNVSGSPYILTCASNVTVGCSLTIDAGVEVRAQSGAALSVYGTLDVNGTSGSVVRFLSDAATPAAGDWAGVSIIHGSGTIDHAIINHANHGVYVNGSSTVTLANVSSRLNNNGLYAYNGVMTVHASDCTFTNNMGYGVFAASYSSTNAPDVTVTGSSIHSNLGSHDYIAGSYAAAATTLLDATGNYWGTTDEVQIRSRIYDHVTHNLAPMVNWCGYLDGPGGPPYALDAHCTGGPVCDETVIWDQTDQPYLLITDLLVCATGTLQVEAGVQVRALPIAELGIEVQGTLDINGAVGNEASFTSHAASPAAGDWTGLRYSSSAVGTIDNAVIGYAVNGIYAEGSSSVTLDGVGVSYNSTAGVYIAGTSATLLNITAMQNPYGVFLFNNPSTSLTGVTATENEYGLYVQGDGTVTMTDVTAQQNDHGLSVYNANATVDVTGGIFTGNNIYGVNAGSYSGSSNPDLTITGSEIHSNLGSYDYASYSFRYAATTVLDATGNYWGSTDEAYIRSRIYDHVNHVQSPTVDWCGYLDGPSGSPHPLGAHCAAGRICDETIIWDQTDQPYLLISDVTVCETGTLQVEAGVEVRALPYENLGIEVYGGIDVNGTTGDEVTFTSHAASPAAGDWTGLRLYASAVGTIDNALIDYTVDGVYGEGSSDLTLNGLGISQCSGSGVYANGASVMTDLSDVAVSQCDNGVYVNGGTATLLGLTATQNTSNGVYLLGECTSTLTDVTTTGSTNGVYIVGNGSATLSNVTSRLNDRGLWVYQGNSTVNATGCTITENNIQGVVAGTYTQGSDPALTITNSSIHSNLGSHDFYAYQYQNPDTTVLWAPDNWWGTMDLEQIRARVFDREDNIYSPMVWIAPILGDCEGIIALDLDADGLGDFEDNCPDDDNAGQADADSDGMGDLCDPDPVTTPVADCDGSNDLSDGYADADSDGWGDPCDFQPTRADSYPGATELCDGRDNDGDGQFDFGELVDDDFDGAMACGDCDDYDPVVYPCACERCLNLADDDCDSFIDEDDSDCDVLPYCILVTPDSPEPVLEIGKGSCGGAAVAGPFEVIRGFMAALANAGGHVDLGDVNCLDGALNWDRMTHMSALPNPVCGESAEQSLFYLARDAGEWDFGASYPDGDPRDEMNPSTPCP